MNIDQALRRVKNILRAARWGGSGSILFARGSIFVSEGPPEDVLQSVRLPAAWIYAGAAQHDEEQPGLYESDIVVTVLVSVPGDEYGEGVLIGRNRASATASDGVGLHRLESELLSNLSYLDASKQFRLTLKAASSAISAPVGGSGYHAARRFTLRSLLTIAYQHQEPRNVAASQVGSDVVLTWDAPDDTTNLTGYIIRRNDAAIPLAFPTEGTDIPWTAGLTVTDTAPGAGTYTYSVFAAYDDEGGSLEFDVSDYGDVELTVT